MAMDEYECSYCHAVMIKRRRINDKPIPTTKCDSCGKSAIYLFSAHAKTPSAWVV